jgi:hypothetical protein
MKPLLLMLLGVGLATSGEVARESRSESIQGVWQVVEVRMLGPTPQTIAIPEPRPNLTIITARHYSRVYVETDKRPVIVDVAHAAADELRAAWGPFAADAGTYELAGNLITLHPVAAKNAAAMAAGSFSTWSYTLEGDTLWVTAERDQNGPVANPVTVKALRVE